MSIKIATDLLESSDETYRLKYMQNKIISTLVEYGINKASASRIAYIIKMEISDDLYYDFIKGMIAAMKVCATLKGGK